MSLSEMYFILIIDSLINDSKYWAGYHVDTEASFIILIRKMTRPESQHFVFYY